MQGLLNPSVRRDPAFRGHFTDAEIRDAHAYYAVHHELAPTPLRDMPGWAEAQGLAALAVKDETRRHGVNAFKIMGVRYAVHRLGDEGRLTRAGLRHGRQPWPGRRARRAQQEPPLHHHRPFPEARRPSRG
jgi:hypothetical protein